MTSKTKLILLAAVVLVPLMQANPQGGEQFIMLICLLALYDEPGL